MNEKLKEQRNKVIENFNHFITRILSKSNSTDRANQKSISGSSNENLDWIEENSKSESSQKNEDSVKMNDKLSVNLFDPIISFFNKPSVPPEKSEKKRKKVKVTKKSYFGLMPMELEETISITSSSPNDNIDPILKTGFNGSRLLSLFDNNTKKKASNKGIDLSFARRKISWVTITRKIGVSHCVNSSIVDKSISKMKNIQKDVIKNFVISNKNEQQINF